jgi:hypothetical protein
MMPLWHRVARDVSVSIAFRSLCFKIKWYKKPYFPRISNLSSGIAAPKAKTLFTL